MFKNSNYLRIASGSSSNQLPSPCDMFPTLLSVLPDTLDAVRCFGSTSVKSHPAPTSASRFSPENTVLGGDLCARGVHCYRDIFVYTACSDSILKKNSTCS